MLERLQVPDPDQESARRIESTASVLGGLCSILKSEYQVAVFHNTNLAIKIQNIAEAINQYLSEQWYINFSSHTGPRQARIVENIGSTPQEEGGRVGSRVGGRQKTCIIYI